MKGTFLTLKNLETLATDILFAVLQVICSLNITVTLESTFKSVNTFCFDWARVSSERFSCRMFVVVKVYTCVSCVISESYGLLRTTEYSNKLLFFQEYGIHTFHCHN